MSGISLRGCIMYAIAATFLCYEMALQVSTSVMTHSLMYDFHINAATLGLVSSFYFYSYAFMQIPVGLLFDHFGVRTLISIAVLFCFLGAILFATTDLVWMIALSRFLMGLGSAFAFVGVLVVAARWFNPMHFALLVGVAQLLAAFGAIFGELPLAHAVNTYGWRHTLYVFAFIGIFLSIIAVFFLTNKFPRQNKGECMIPKERSLKKHLSQVIHKKSSWMIALYAFSGWGPMAVFASLWGVPFLVKGYSITNVQAAIYIMFMWLGMGLGAPFFGWLSDYINRKRVILVISSAVGFLVSLIVIYSSTLSSIVLYVLLFSMGLASAAHILTFALVKEELPDSCVATGIGFNNMAVVITGALLQPIIGWILVKGWDGVMINNVPSYALSDYRLSLFIVPLCYLIGFVDALFFLPKEKLVVEC